MEIMIPGITIQEAAEQTGLTTHTLRYYEQIELIPAVERETNGHRLFPDIFTSPGLNNQGWLSYFFGGVNSTCIG